MGCSQSQPLFAHVGDPAANPKARRREMKSVLVEAVQPVSRKKKADAACVGQKLRFLNDTALSRLRDSQSHIESFRRPHVHASVVSNTFDTQNASLIFGPRRTDDEGSGDTVEAPKKPTADSSPVKPVREAGRGPSTANNVRAIKRELQRCLPSRGRRRSGRFGGCAQDSQTGLTLGLSQATPRNELLPGSSRSRPETPALPADSKAIYVKRQQPRPHGRSLSLGQFRLTPAKPNHFDRDRARDRPPRRSSLVLANQPTALPATFADLARKDLSKATRPKIRLLSKDASKRVPATATAADAEIRSVLTACPSQKQPVHSGGDVQASRVAKAPADGRPEESQPAHNPKVLYSTSMRKKPDAIMYFPFVVKKKRRPPEPSAQSQIREATSPSMRAAAETYCLYINGRFACRATCKPRKPSAPS